MLRRQGESFQALPWIVKRWNTTITSLGTEMTPVSNTLRTEADPEVGLEKFDFTDSKGDRSV